MRTRLGGQGREQFNCFKLIKESNFEATSLWFFNFSDSESIFLRDRRTIFQSVNDVNGARGKDNSFKGILGEGDRGKKLRNGVKLFQIFFEGARKEEAKRIRARGKMSELSGFQGVMVEGEEVCKSELQIIGDIQGNPPF